MEARSPRPAGPCKSFTVVTAECLAGRRPALGLRQEEERMAPPDSPAAAAGQVAGDPVVLPVTFAIIGTGFSGLGAAIALRRAGYHALVLLERADDVGGTWRDNTYPGCRCDVQSNLYSFSFAPKPDWSETFPPQPELRGSLRNVADADGLRPLIRCGHEVTAAGWDEDGRRWRITT